MGRHLSLHDNKYYPYGREHQPFSNADSMYKMDQSTQLGLYQHQENNMQIFVGQETFK